MSTEPEILFDTTRFGRIAYAERDLVRFKEGILGFSSDQRYVLISHSQESRFTWLQSVEDGSLAFLLVDPASYVCGYAPELPAAAVKSLALDEVASLVVYAIVTVPNGRPAEMTLNLAGPIVINAQTREAKQIVLDGEAYSVRHRAVAASTEGDKAAA